MLGQLWKPVTPAVSACVWLLVAARGGTGQIATPRAEEHGAKVANPAARKCLADGYALEPVLAADGLAIDHECVDKTSGRRCEVWSYFRGTCRLRPGSPHH